MKDPNVPKMDIKYELINYLQKVIANRIESKRNCLVSSLTGHINNPQLKRWFTAHYRQLSSSSLSLFIQSYSRFFKYDIKTGNVSNNQLLDLNHMNDELINGFHNSDECETKSFKTIDEKEEPIVSSYIPFTKPKYLVKLEENKTSDDFCLSNGQKLSTIEIIIYLFKTLRALKGSVGVEDMYCLLKQNMTKQMSAINLCQPLKSNCIESLAISNMLIDLKDVFQFNESKQTICLFNNHNQWLNHVEDMFDKSLNLIFKNFLITQFQKFGRKTVEDIEDKLNDEHNYMFEYLFGEQYGYGIIDFIERYQQDFSVNYLSNNSHIIIDVNPNLLTEKMRFNFQLKYKFGNQINDLEGIVLFLREDKALIRSQIAELNSIFYFKVERDVTIFGEEVITEEGLKVFLHTEDRVCFNAVIKRSVNIETGNAEEYSWFVTRINKVFHSGKCYLLDICEHSNQMDSQNNKSVDN